jgi:hypothetical protein
MASVARPGLASLARAADPVIFHIDRENVQRCEVAPPLKALRAMALTPETTRKYAGRVQFVFTGYEHDPRELYSIPEVRAFIGALNDEFPYWFHFSSKVDDSLFVILMSLLSTASAIVHCGKAQVAIDPGEWDDLTLGLFEFMNGLYAHHGLTPEENSRTTQQVLTYVRTFYR